MSATPSAGWYPDPYDPSQIRYWDGANWTDHVSPAQAAAPGPEPALAEQASAGGAAVDPNVASTQPLGVDKTQTLPGFDPDASAAGPTQLAQPPGAELAPGSVHGYQAPGASEPASLPGGWPPGGYGDVYGAQPWGAQNTGWAPASHGGIGDIGDWLSSTFTRLFERIGPMALFVLAVEALIYVVMLGLFWVILSDISVDDSSIGGFSPSVGFTAAVVGFIAIFVWLWGQLAASHQMYSAHAGQPQSIGRSAIVALRRLPRMIGWGILMFLLIVAVFAVLWAGIVATIVGIGTTDGGATALLGFVLFLVLVLGVVLAVFLFTKLAFFQTALAVGPSGTNPFGASWSISKGRFWGVFGRLLLMGVLLWLISFIFNFAFQAIFGAALGTIFQADPVTGDVLINGQDPATIDVIRFSDFIPGLGWFLALGVVAAAGRAVIDMLWISAASGLYLRGGGPGEV